MHKNWLIIQREYLSRVKKKSFVIITLLIPLLFAGFIALEVFIATGGSSDMQKIAVVDESNLFSGKLQDGQDIFFTFLKDENVSEAQKTYATQGYDGLLVIPDIDVQNPGGFVFYSENKLGLNSYLYITDQLDEVIKNKRMVLAGIDQEALDKMDVNVSMAQPASSEGGSGASPDDTKYITYASSAIGYISGFLIYFALLLFGTQVLRGVAEEKTNRISEIMVSSVKPFQLMIGKIIGIGAVGLTQFIIWIVLFLIGLVALGGFMPDVQSVQQAQQVGVTAGNMQMAKAIEQVKDLLYLLPITQIVLLFLFYFFGGYLLYSALFAAVGSAVDQEMTESQSLTLPITMPIIISFFIMFSTIQHPNSGLSVFCSIFPLSSPLVMMARIPYGVPTWQLILSVVLLIAGFVGTTWIAGKIYRTGILMYGKKVTLKELVKWAFRKS